MLQEEAIPCQRCKAGMHRTCSRPMAVPTLWNYVKTSVKAPTETLACCDKKEFWTTPVYD